MRTTTGDRKRQLGFGLGLGGGLFELVILPAIIIAILVLIAIPAYSDFQTRARVSEELTVVAAAAQGAVERAFVSRGPSDMSKRATTGWIRPGSRPFLQSADIGRDGTITLRFTSDIAPQEENQLQIVPTSGGKALDLSEKTNAGVKFAWQCGGGKTTLPEKHRPEQCRPGVK